MPTCWGVENLLDLPDAALHKSIEQTVRMLRNELARMDIARRSELAAAGGLESPALPAPSGNGTAGTLPETTGLTPPAAGPLVILGKAGDEPKVNGKSKPRLTLDRQFAFGYT